MYPKISVPKLPDVKLKAEVTDIARVGEPVDGVVTMRVQFWVERKELWRKPVRFSGMVDVKLGPVVPNPQALKFDLFISGDPTITEMGLRPWKNGKPNPLGTIFRCVPIHPPIPSI